MHFARKPTPAERAAAMTAGPGSPEAILVRLRQIFLQDRDAALAMAERIRYLVRNTGRAQLEAALGPDAAELQQVYDALKTYILTIDETATVEDLPSE